MKLPTPLQLSALALGLLGHGASGAPLAGKIQPLRGGLQVQLQTGSLKVVIAPPAAPADSTTPARAANSGVPVSALVINRSNSDLAIGFPSAEAAKNRITFNLFDSAGGLLWSSDAGLPEGDDVEAVLLKHEAWKKLALIPGSIGDAPLTPGVYLVEVSVGTDKVIGDAATLEMADAASNAEPVAAIEPAKPALPPAGGTKPPVPPIGSTKPAAPVR